MRKMKVLRRDGGRKSVQVGAVGTVVWNGVTGELKIDGEPGYLDITKAIASLMLVGDQFVNLAAVRAEVYPVYGNENVVNAVLTIVSANAGQVLAHDPEHMKPRLEALGAQAIAWGLMVETSDVDQPLLPFLAEHDKAVQ